MTHQHGRLLVIDDEENMRHFLRELLEHEGYDVCLAADGREGLAQLEQGGFSAVLCDLRMPGMDGMEFLRQASRRGPLPTVITMSAYGTIDLAIESMQQGAYDYISKPFKPQEILLALKKARERERLRQENRELRRAVGQQAGFSGMIGRSPVMQQVFALVRKVAAVSSPVLITGPSGTGKELIARAIHTRSPRADGPFVAVNCAAIPETLLESELFGHARGAFTGAAHERRGIFEEAHGGTLLLDEIGDLPPGLQVKLLRVLQEAEIRRIGEERVRSVDVRTLASTAKDLPRAVAAGTFREDLYYRLNVLPVRLPPLRERIEDIPLLAAHCVRQCNARHGMCVQGLTPQAMQRLMSHAWPGNVRELEHLIERTMILSEATRIDVPDLEPFLAGAALQPEALSGGELSIKKMSRRLEADLIGRALRTTGGNKSRAARLLEISYPALLSKIAQYGLDQGN